MTKETVPVQTELPFEIKKEPDDTTFCEEEHVKLTPTKNNKNGNPSTSAQHRNEMNDSTNKRYNILLNP